MDLGRPPEFLLLLHCCRTQFSLESLADVRRLTNGNIQQIVRLAERHGVLPVLYWNLARACPEVIPEDVFQKLQQSYQENTERNLFLAGELVKVWKLLAPDIRAIPYKGPTAAVTLYGSLGLRKFVDLDVLISRDDVERAKSVLVSADYRPEFTLTANQERLYLANACEYNFISPDGALIEIHWQVLPRCYSLEFDFDRLWKRTGRLTLGGVELPTLSLEDLLLILTTHATKHRWREMRWVCDVAQLLQSGTVDLDAVLASARHVGAERMVLLALRLARDLLGAELNAGTVRRLSEPTIESLAANVCEGMYGPGPQPYSALRDHLFLLRTRERWRDRCRFAMRTWLTPESVPLVGNSRSFPLRRVSRFVRVLEKFASGCWQYVHHRPADHRK